MSMGRVLWIIWCLAWAGLWLWLMLSVLALTGIVAFPYSLLLDESARGG